MLHRDRSKNLVFIFFTSSDTQQHRYHHAHAAGLTSFPPFHVSQSKISVIGPRLRSKRGGISCVLHHHLPSPTPPLFFYFISFNFYFSFFSFSKHTCSEPARWYAKRKQNFFSICRWVSTVPGSWGGRGRSEERVKGEMEPREFIVIAIFVSQGNMGE